MERVRILLTLLLLFYGGISYAGTEPPLTLISLTKAKEGNLLYFKVGFSSLPPYEFYQFPSRNLAVVKFTHAISGTCEISFLDTASLVEKRFLKELRFVPSESTLRIIMNLAQGVKTKVYTLHSTKEVVIELERERDRRLEYREILLSQGEAKVRISLLGLDLNDPDLLITPVLARDKIPGLEETSSMARRLRALGGINGGYFAPNGDPLGLLIIDGELISEPILDRSAIAFTKDGEIVFGNVDFKGKVLFKLNERIIDLDGINRKAAPQEIILYTPHYGPKTGRDDAGLELIVIEGKIIRIYSKDAPIPRNGYVISLPQGW
ncbi:TPA: hypothetical protein DCX15_01855, partial [bacterium]|nr:hypothetical protein [bacterium]